VTFLAKTISLIEVNECKRLIASVDVEARMS